MNRSRSDFLRTAGLTAAGLPLLARPAHAAGNLPVKLGWQLSMNGARYFVAEHGGIFAKNGLDVTSTKFTAAPAFFPALQSGAIDVAFMSTPAASVGIAQGAPLNIFAVENYARSSEGLVVTKTSGITALKEVKGKKIATLRGTSAHYALSAGLKKAGLGFDDITMVDLSVTSLLPAFQRGDIDGGWYWEPWQGEMRSAGGTQITTDGAVNAIIGILWVGRPEWLAQNGETVLRLLKSIDEATTVIRKDPEKAASYLLGDLGVTKELALEVITKEATWPTMRESWDPNYIESINPKALDANKGLMAALQPLAQFQHEVRSITQIPDFRKSIDTKFVAQYLGVK